MTGSGKTHTMLGDIYNIINSEEGLCSLAIESIFQNIKKDQNKEFKLKVSYLEIYNEQVKDLLNDNPTKGSSLMLIEDPITGVQVPDLSEFIVNNSEELIDLLLKGNERRTMAATSVNQFSSRSHAILQIMLESYDSAKGIVNTGKLSFVDLAGSERAATTENRGMRMIEGSKINRSLLALGNCINILSDKLKGNANFVPYRDSKLTRLLKDSLGGNTKTVMIACVTPTVVCFEENINTLKYAVRAKMIKTKVSRNVKEIGQGEEYYKDIINSLKTEVNILKKLLHEQKIATQSVSPLKSRVNIIKWSSAKISNENSIPEMIDINNKKLLTKEIEKFNKEFTKIKELRNKYKTQIKLEGSYIKEISKIY